MNHPLLTKLLTGVLSKYGIPPFAVHDDVAELGAIADALEAALDVCQWGVDSGWGACGQDRGAPEHDTFTHDTAGPHPPNYGCHPFVPLVTP